jgi:hypothetical protein
MFYIANLQVYNIPNMPCRNRYLREVFPLAQDTYVQTPISFFVFLFLSRHTHLPTRNKDNEKAQLRGY